MKLLTRKEYECLSPVKRSVYEKRVKKYYGSKAKAFTTEPWKSFLERSSTVMLYDPFSGHRFVTSKDFLDANETAVSILAKDESMTIDEAMTKVKMAVEITVIIAGFMAIGAICFMNQRMTAMEKELNYYKEHVQEQEETKLQIVDTVTGRVIYEE